MTPAVAAILEGMPEPRDLRLHHVDGRCLVTAGSRLLFDYDAADVVMRNVAICSLRQLGFAGRRVAAVFGLTENYVATLHSAALREGSAALVRRPAPGRPGKLGGADWEQAAAWRAQGVSDAEIGRRLGVADTTVGRRPCPRPEGPCARGWPASLTPPTRWNCRPCSPGRCWPPTRSPPACTTSMTTSCPIPEPGRSARAGTTSAAGRRGAGPTPTSPAMTRGRCALSPASRPGWPSPCRWRWPS